MRSLVRIQILTYFFAIVSIVAVAQSDDFSNPRSISGGSRTYNANVTGNSKCPNTYEYVPNGYDFNLKTKKYPLIISLPGLSEMIQPDELLADAVIRLANVNEYLNAGVNLKIESNEFPPTTDLMGTPYQFIVVTIQCEKDNGVEFTANLPAAIDDVLSNYLILEKYLDKIDLDRIYLTGTSRGGGLIYEFMESIDRANKIAAIVPIAPGTPILQFNDLTKEASVNPVHTARFNTIVSNIANTSSVGIYSAHNVVDQSVFISASRLWTASINEVNPGKAQLREFAEDPAPYSNHNAWRRAYNSGLAEFNGNSSNIYQWMLSRVSNFAALPVTLTTFNAIAKGNEVALTWSTASESNSSHFAVERSSNGRDFKEIGRVKSNGNSTTAKNYSFTDKAPLTGKNFYRIKMVDLDATFKFSEMRTVNLNGSDLEFSFGPNPVQTEASIRITGSQRVRLTLTVTDLMGRTMKTLNFIKQDNNFTQKISLAELPIGQYVLTIKGDNVNYTHRIMKR